MSFSSAGHVAPELDPSWVGAWWGPLKVSCKKRIKRGLDV
ncbi:hypothetical protein SLEP1_g25845 [Rubroshorea leprosula]|uniref:Uncharacterized protein n=1 Tax=Rubroshorea leprosula TaxID=152421 RepID=A0AAV5JRE7_9ROSI|nr:hypothetical protein SLEP1_g25845 [Rubroshorea leprosula]